MDYNDTTRLAGNLLAPFVWAVLLGLFLWLFRRLFPRAVPYFFGPISNVGYLIGLLAGRACRAIRRSVA
jgi:hypothetical protein